MGITAAVVVVVLSMIITMAILLAIFVLYKTRRGTYSVKTLKDSDGIYNNVS